MTDKQFQFHPGSVKKAMQAAGAKSSDLWKVPRSQVKFDPDFNVRTRGEKFDERVRRLADSMKANGYYQDKPLVGYVAKDEDSGEDVIVLTDGFTRLAAVDLAVSEGAQIDLLPVITKPNGTSMEDLTIAFVNGNEGTPLTPYEIGKACKRLVQYGMSEGDVAFRLGFGEKYVNDLLLLMGSPSEVRKLVESDLVSAHMAITTLRKHGPKTLDILKKGIEQAQAQGKQRATPKHVKAASGAAPKVAKPVLLRSVQYLKEKKLDEDDRFLSFLAFLGGMQSADELKGFIAAEQEKAQKKATKAEKAGKKAATKDAQSA